MPLPLSFHSANVGTVYAGEWVALYCKFVLFTYLLLYITGAIVGIVGDGNVVGVCREIFRNLLIGIDYRAIRLRFRQSDRAVRLDYRAARYFDFFLLAIVGPDPDGLLYRCCRQEW